MEGRDYECLEEATDAAVPEIYIDDSRWQLAGKLLLWAAIVALILICCLARYLKTTSVTMPADGLQTAQRWEQER